MENTNPSSPPDSPNSFRNRKICEINELLETLNLTAPPLERYFSYLEADVRFVELFNEYEIGDLTFGGKARDLSSIWEETGRRHNTWVYQSVETASRFCATPSEVKGDDVTTICDAVTITDLKKPLEDSTG
ncbi:hypothetical protein Tco_1275527 [Tanacetum coccineum]